MEQFISSNLKLGILGGGQLGKMLCQVANNWDVKTYVLDPNANCSASGLCTKYEEGDFKDFETVYNFGKELDVVTIEIEAVNTDALIKLQNEGVKIFPDPRSIETIQDKGLQKQIFTNKDISTSPFCLFENAEEVRSAVNTGTISIPFVQKTRKDGYDGRGVKIVRSDEDLLDLLQGKCLVEDLVDLDKEIAVIVAQNDDGEISCFPPVEMEFNPQANLVEFLSSPSDLTEGQYQRANELAMETIKAFNVVGVLAVEMFIDSSGHILVNEIAPRPHNSGHHTIEANLTSQYEQHLRAILNYPLGDTSIISPAVMLNVLGEPGYEGPVKYDGLEQCMKVSGFNLHIYGKEVTKPFRKMGHVTVLDNDLNSAKDKARYIRKTLKAIS
ncbi:5-(carboxyamino)imidazole ribonucleotide synthase [Flavobacteriales bacterium]|jgi:5-(carboxyamino)imidazole ribonucleotide synthase|nr:5-(carboxyamino)imidazole ribonucleotide synthase [Flavobacteriales bacterium]